VTVTEIAEVPRMARPRAQVAAIQIPRAISTTPHPCSNHRSRRVELLRESASLSHARPNAPHRAGGSTTPPSALNHDASSGKHGSRAQVQTPVSNRAGRSSRRARPQPWRPACRSLRLASTSTGVPSTSRTTSKPASARRRPTSRNAALTVALMPFVPSSRRAASSARRSTSTVVRDIGITLALVIECARRRVTLCARSCRCRTVRRRAGRLWAPSAGKQTLV
jgi:hypothetical protein